MQPLAFLRSGLAVRAGVLALLGGPLLEACAPEPAPVVNSLGEQVYGRLCVNCHRAEGRGAVGEVPPLLRHFPEVIAAANGRRYVIRATLYGIEGPMRVGGKPYAGLMTPMSYLKDEELSAVLNYVALSWGNEAALPRGFAPFLPSEIATERKLGLRPRQVLDQRPAALGATRGTP